MEFVEALKKSREFSGVPEDFNRAIRLMEVDALQKKAEAEKQKADAMDEFVKVMKANSARGHFRVIVGKP